MATTTKTERTQFFFCCIIKKMDVGEPLEDFEPRIRWPFNGAVIGSSNAVSWLVGLFGWILMGWEKDY